MKMKNFIQCGLENIKGAKGSVRTLLAVFVMFFGLAFTSSAQNFVARDIAVQRLSAELNILTSVNYPVGTASYVDARNKASFYKTILGAVNDGEDVATAFNVGLAIFRIQGKPSLSQQGAYQTEVTEPQLKKLTSDGLKLLTF